MNNYSWLQQKLHQFALSTKFMREVAFDVENSLAKKNFNEGSHVFVAGLARSGTTILLNALYKSQDFASLSYADMPFVLSPNLWSKISSKKHSSLQERAHGDGIKVSTESPEAFEEVFWKTFSDEEEEVQEKFKDYVSCIITKYNKNRYLSKNNQNIRRLNLISEIFPDSIILIPFRDPIQHANSLLKQHLKFLKQSKEDKFISNYMKWIGHTEFGPNYIPIINEKDLLFNDYTHINHWIEQWCFTYGQFIKDGNTKSNFNFVCYESLCESNDYFEKILDLLNIKDKYSFDFKESKKEVLTNIDNILQEESSKIYKELIRK